MSPAHRLEDLVTARSVALVSLSSFAFAARDRVAEIDVNPLIALPRGEGALAVDGLVVIER